MAAAPSSLKHYSFAQTTANTWQTAVAAVAAGRALAVSKIILTNTTAGSIVVYVVISSGATSAAYRIVDAVTLAPGQVYTESGVVVLAGESIQVNSTVASSLGVNVFGEEVDN